MKKKKRLETQMVYLDKMDTNNLKLKKIHDIHTKKKKSFSMGNSEYIMYHAEITQNNEHIKLCPQTMSF